MQKLKRIVLIMMAAVMVVFAGCGKSGGKKVTDSSVVAKINGVEITLEEAKFYAYMEQANYEAYYIAYGKEVDWSYATTDEDGNDSTLEKVVIDESMDIIYKQKLFRALADEYGITLDDEDNVEIETEVSDFFSDSDEELIAKIGASEEMVRSVYTEVQIYTKVCEKILEENPVTITDEDAHQGYYIVAIIDDSFSSQESTAKAICDRVKNGEAIDYVADKFGAEISEGNVGKGDMNNALEDLCLSLKTKETGYVGVDGYYYVVYCSNDDDTEATAIAKQQKQEDAEAEVIQSKFESLKADADIKVYDDILSTISFSENIFTLDDVEDATTTTDETTTEETTTEQETTTA